MQVVFGKALNEVELEETIQRLLQKEIIALGENGLIAHRNRANAEGPRVAA